MPVKHIFLNNAWKNTLAAVGLLSVFALLVCFPSVASAGASQGLLLWFQVLIPSLLPFFLLSGFLIRSGLISSVSTVTYPLLGRFFHTTPEGATCILIGFLCGYPLGARTVADLYERKQLSRPEATYLLCLTNNVSPGFLSGFVVNSCFRRRELLFPALLCVYGLPVVCSGILRRKIFVARYCDNPIRRLRTTSRPIYQRNHRLHPQPTLGNHYQKSPAQTRQLSTQSISHTGPAIQAPNLSFAVIDETIRSSLASMAMLGGYVILFRILMQFLFAAPLSVHTKTALAGILEITSGIPMIVANAVSFTYAFPAVMAVLAFGGLSGLAQTRSVLSQTDLSIRSYVCWKLFLAVLAWGCASLYS